MKKYDFGVPTVIMKGGTTTSSYDREMAKRKADAEANGLPQDCRVDRCRSCGAEIVWAKTENGKSAPFDLKLTSGQYTIDAAGVAHHVRTRVSHWATCPSPNQHWKDTR